MTKPLCPKCSDIIYKNGKHKSSQRWRCKSCGYNYTEGGRKKGKPLLGDRPLTVAERVRRHREKLKKQVQ